MLYFILGCPDVETLAAASRGSGRFQGRLSGGRHGPAKSPPVTAKIKCLNSYDLSDLSNLSMIAKYCQCILSTSSHLFRP